MPLLPIRRLMNVGIWLGVGLGASYLCFPEAVQGQDGRPAAAPTTVGSQLYEAHCAGCHGIQGDGNGVAARFLYPKPRNFRRGKFRLVSSTNRVPSRDDLRAVLVRGMPGSSMPSWGHLPESERESLIDEVLRLYRDGVREPYVASLKQDEQLSDEEIRSAEVQAEIKQFVDRSTTPEAIAEVPQMPAADAAAIARGRELYIKQSCHSCHGNEGKGDGVQKMVDDEGFATRPRDLTRGIYKGGHDPASLYRRIFYGMPGTPMPASANLTPGQAADMIHFLLSLSTERQRESVILRRQTLDVARVAKVPSAVADDAWQSVAAVPVQTFPLWWRDDADAALSAQGVHDGKAIAIRLTWRDRSRNTSAVKPDEFEDMVALELYRGSPEPFLGMGSTTALVDAWQWRAGREDTGAANFLSDDYPFDSPIYRQLLKQEQLPDFITARAGGNPLALRRETAGSLAVKGPGSTTFRPRESQVVTAQAAWQDGAWTVVLTRPLAVDANAGVPLSAGQTVSVAFALWDGAARDRGPQKQISIWHDLKLR